MLSGLSFLAATEAGEALRRHMRAAIIAAMGAVAGLGGIVFCLIALHAWLLQRMSPVEASLVIAAGLIVLSLIFVAVAAFIRRSRRQPSALAATALVATPVALRLLGGRLDFKALGIAGVLALGAIAGRQLGKMRI
jgi:hypothetical protein